MSLKEKLISGLYTGGACVASGLSNHLDIPYKEIINGYGHDVTLPLGLYFFNKLIDSQLGKNKWVNAAFVFLGCSAMEAAQGLGLYSGTFDPKDFVAYAAGASLAVAMDKLTFRKKNLDNLV